MLAPSIQSPPPGGLVCHPTAPTMTILGGCCCCRCGRKDVVSSWLLHRCPPSVVHRLSFDSIRLARSLTSPCGSVAVVSSQLGSLCSCSSSTIASSTSITTSIVHQCVYVFVCLSAPLNRSPAVWFGNTGLAAILKDCSEKGKSRAAVKYSRYLHLLDRLVERKCRRSSDS